MVIIWKMELVKKRVHNPLVWSVLHQLSASNALLMAIILAAMELVIHAILKVIV